MTGLGTTSRIEGQQLDHVVVEQIDDVGCPKEIEVIEGRHVDPVEALQVAQPLGQPRHVLKRKTTNNNTKRRTFY